MSVKLNGKCHVGFYASKENIHIFLTKPFRFECFFFFQENKILIKTENVRRPKIWGLDFIKNKFLFKIGNDR